MPISRALLRWMIGTTLAAATGCSAESGDTSGPGSSNTSGGNTSSGQVGTGGATSGTTGKANGTGGAGSGTNGTAETTGSTAAGTTGSTNSSAATSGGMSNTGTSGTDTTGAGSATGTLDAGKPVEGGASGGRDGGSTSGSTTTGGNDGRSGAFPFTPPYMLGADISWTLEQEARGTTYSDNGKVEPIEQIFVNNGFNYIRIRTFVNPSASDGYSPGKGFCDIAHTVTLAKRVKACGMGILLDFHMSDTWASIGVQHVPSAWAGLSPADMQKAAHDYVKSSLAQMVEAGVEPDMVQIGNETNSAISGVSMSNWADFSGLVNAGIKAVRETDPKIIVIAQHGRPRPDGNFEPWVDKYLAGNPPIDVDGICGSTYGTTNNGADWTMEFSYVIDKYNKPVWSCEYTDDHRALINNVMHGLPKGMGRGTFIWEPTQYGQPLFDNSGGKLVTNARMAEYPKLAKSYGLPVPSGTCR